MRRVVIPPFPGAFSAWGMLMTEPRVDRVQTRVLALEATTRRSSSRLFAASDDGCHRRAGCQGFAAESSRPRSSLDMRYRGQEHTVEVPIEATPSPTEHA